MSKKELYTPPQVDVLEMNYADPVCQATSGTPDYDYNPIDLDGLDLIPNPFGNIILP